MWSNRWVWVGAAVLVVVLSWAAWDDVRSWWLRRATVKQQQEITETLKQGSETKKAVQDLRRQRDAALKKANEEAAEIRRLKAEAERLATARAAVRPPKTLEEAADALRRWGY